MEKIIKYIRSQRQQYVEELFQLLRVPSVSTDPDHAGDVTTCSQFLAEHLKAIGMHKVEIMPTEGHPVVYAEWLEAPETPTILIYGHYDVQPPDPLDQWESPPFEPQIRNKKIYARGASDNKGQFFAHLKAIEAYFKQDNRLPVNLKLLLEGEEEIGSKHLDAFVRQHAEQLKADAIIISDTNMFAPETPTICYGTRGLIGLQIDIQGASHDLHSGSYGGIVANPVQVLADILSSLKDRDGRVAIPGFYEDVLDIQEKEKQQFHALSFDEEEIKKDTGVPELWGEKGFSTLERRWTRPTLDVNGISGGFSGEGVKTIIPAKAMAKVTMRLVPNQDPERILQAFKAYVESLAPPTVTLKITEGMGVPAYLTPLEHPVLSFVSKALQEAFGRDPVFVRSGGSIGILNTFSEVLQVPIVFVGLSQPNDNAHAPNEHMNEDAFYTGIEVAARLYNELEEWKV